MNKLKVMPDTVNAVYLPYLTDNRRYQIYFGGSSSGKSVFLATRCVLDTLCGRNTLIVRKVARTLRGSCWNEIMKTISRLRLTKLFDISKADFSITAVNNGSQILFAGLDDVEKIKSITPANGTLTDIWIEEATEAAYEDYKQLDKRLRGESNHTKRMTLSFNPVYKTHWIYREFFSGWQEDSKSLETDALSILKTTYKDNRFLTADDRFALENEKDDYFREVYTLGNWGVLGDVIFRNFKTADLSEEARAYPSRFYGLDFGFSQDPCAAVDAAVDYRHHRIMVFNEIYERGLTNSMLAERLRTFCRNNPITCDSAEPKSIQEIRNLGIDAHASKKGVDSVVHGIQWLQGFEILLDVNCPHLREEMTLYQWRKDKDGNSLAQPEDKNNHAIDALRYALESESMHRERRSMFE